MLPKSTAGFNLPELMITLAILLIFCTIALPAMADFIDRQRANAYVRQFSQHLAYARVAATSSNLPVQLCPVSGSQCEHQWNLHPIQLSVLQPNNAPPVLLREIPQVHSKHKLTYHRQALTFRRDGSLNGFENGTFYYCGKDGSQWHYQLTLNQAGRNRLTEVSAPCPL
ncbi:GspH/FimT family pseudopilin [Rheinheimera maricola]|uniref:Type II secretion system protein H n=1 Tax=Rheinheimera maricola TaxID=2793282 RepID=A0ABS7XD61_9GAMM|nr:GspH/FimT family pseudopilin [Rheinheimera maricola]MBZ9612542.1 GspH/FimT family pseudopilin [Rheinheimera maricola]